MSELTPDLEALKQASTADLLDAIEALLKISVRPCTTAHEPARLPWSSIIEIPSVFQVRGEHTDERHATALFDVLKRENDLRPVTVWRCGEGAVLLDGHHRLHAYKRMQGRSRVAEGVPVVWFRGNLDDAIKAAAEANNEVKLPLNTHQRMNLGWRLVVLDRYSKKETAKMAGISERTVANMRTVRKTLELSGVGRDELPLNWWRASKEARRLDAREERLDYEDFKLPIPMKPPLCSEMIAPPVS
ncbi:hypothetical protein C7U62_01310, partial [Mesorhizobium loti]